MNRSYHVGRMPLMLVWAAAVFFGCSDSGEEGGALEATCTAGPQEACVDAGPEGGERDTGPEDPPTDSAVPSDTASADSEAADSGAPEVDMSEDAVEADTATSPADVEGDTTDTATPEDVEEVEAVFAPTGSLGHAGRVVSIETPNSIQDARRRGCQVFGYNVGTGISSVLSLAGGLDQYLGIDAEGQIPLHLLAIVEGYEAGEVVSDRSEVDLHVVYGVLDEEGRTWVDRGRSFVDGDSGSELFSTFPQTLVTEAGWAETPPGRLRLTVPILFDLLLTIDMESTQLYGRLEPDGEGVGAEQLVLTGYLTEQRMIDLLRTIKDQCISDTPPLLCNLIGSGITDPERPVDELLETGVGLFNGFDAHVSEEGFPYPCQPQTERVCNAASLCFLLELEGVAVDGVEP